MRWMVLRLNEHWGVPPWEPVRFKADSEWPKEERADACVVGAGFTGLSTAVHLLRLRPDWRVVVLEAGRVGSAASGRTGGIVLEGTSTGPAPGFEGCVDGLARFMEEEGIDCGWEPRGAWEVDRVGGARSPIAWNDYGVLRVVREIPGGVVEPGRLLTGLARAVLRRGGSIHEGADVAEIEPTAPPALADSQGRRLEASKMALAGGALMIDLLGLNGEIFPFHTLALATEPLSGGVLRGLGWESRIPFYTVELPYLWGRMAPDGRAVIGAGIVPLGTAECLEDEDPRSQMKSLEDRVHGLADVMRSVAITHRWAGPIGLTADGKPRLVHWAGRPDVVGAAGYSGHGVALGIRIGRLLAEALVEGRPLPGRPHALSARSARDKIGRDPA